MSLSFPGSLPVASRQSVIPPQFGDIKQKPFCAYTREETVPEERPGYQKAVEQRQAEGPYDPYKRIPTREELQADQ
jgi:hypothetical protein